MSSAALLPDSCNDLQGSDDDDDVPSSEFKTSRFVVCSFWLLGLLNNSSWVIMIASAKSISTGGVALVFLADTLPGLCVKATSPFWFDLVGYRARFVWATGFMAAAFCLVGFGGSLQAELAGVSLCSAQSALGEASLLALASRFPKRGSDAVAAWSSGTGFAGVFGYAWVAAFTFLLGRVGTQLIALMTLPVAYAIAASSLVANGPTADKDAEPVAVIMSFQDRVAFGVSLWPVTGTIFTVYFAEYAMQSGVWAAMGFPVHSNKARYAFYELGNSLYQAGVLVSRSSALFFNRVDLQTLWGFSLAQSVCLLFFALDATYRFWYDPSVYPLCFVVGLFGGAVYVFGFRHLSASVPPHLAELAMTCGAFAADAGIILSDLLGLFLQSCIYEHNRIRGATFRHIPFCAPAS